MFYITQGFETRDMIPLLRSNALSRTQFQKKFTVFLCFCIEIDASNSHLTITLFTGWNWCICVKKMTIGKMNNCLCWGNLHPRRSSVLEEPLMLASYNLNILWSFLIFTNNQLAWNDEESLECCIMDSKLEIWPHLYKWMYPFFGEPGCDLNPYIAVYNPLFGPLLIFTTSSMEC